MYFYRYVFSQGEKRKTISILEDLSGWKKWKSMITSSLKDKPMEAQSLMLFDGVTLFTGFLCFIHGALPTYSLNQFGFLFNSFALAIW